MKNTTEAIKCFSSGRLRDAGDARPGHALATQGRCKIGKPKTTCKTWSAHCQPLADNERLQRTMHLEVQDMKWHHPHCRHMTSIKTIYISYDKRMD